MTKVLHLISSMNIGGAETMVKDYALLLDKKQFDIMIISLDKCYHSANEKILEQGGIPVIHLSEMRYSADCKMNFLRKIKRSIGRYIDLRNIVKEYKPDIIHAHLFLGNYLRWIPLKKWEIRLYYTVHNEPSFYYDASGKNREKYKAYQEICRLLKKEDATLIALHDNMKDELRQLFHTERVITVNNGINMSRFKRELYNKDEKKQQLGIALNTFVVGHVGRFHEQKNHDLIIDVFKEVVRQRDAHLLLIGDGPLRPHIEDKIRKLGLDKQVTILQNRADIPELLNVMDVFLFPSLWEGFGNVLIEAQSMGLPCVVSDRVASCVKINDNIRTLALEAPIEEWVEAVENVKAGEVSSKLSDYEMKNSVLRLQQIYEGVI